jgi:hypothetical protein
VGSSRKRDDFAKADHRGRSTGCACARDMPSLGGVYEPFAMRQLTVAK